MTAPRAERFWTAFDGRTGERVTQASWISRERMERQIEAWKRRQEKGGRPDVDARYLVAGPTDGLSDEAWEARNG